MEKEFQLPEKLSDCLKLALKDLEAVRNDSNYIVDFLTWHHPIYLDVEDQFSSESDYTRCKVCFAGSIMAKTFNGDTEKEIEPASFSEYNANRFYAIDFVRRGNIAAALKTINQPYNESEIPKVVDVNQNNYEQFVKDINFIIMLLQENDF